MLLFLTICAIFKQPLYDYYIKNKVATELKAYNICNQTLLITLFIDITIRQPVK